MPNGRLALALEQLGPGDWLDFEKFAAEYLVIEYPGLRTTASPSGDKGRDGELYEIGEEPDTMLQYSVSVDWENKIKATAKRLAATRPLTRRLIYATNQVIGANGDDLKTDLRTKNKISLDIRDRSWFVERELTHPQRQAAAEELAVKYVDPLLEKRGVQRAVAPVLEEQEARIAILHLALDREDKATEKGLTKSSFESLVLSALYGTDSDDRLTSDAVVARVRKLLPAGFSEQVGQLAESALARLSKRGGPVKHWRSTDDYCLAHEEQQRAKARVAEYLMNENELSGELALAAQAVVPGRKFSADENTQIGEYLRFCLESVLLKRGESFAAAVSTGNPYQVTARDILEVIDEADYSWNGLLNSAEAATAVVEILDRPTPILHRHLRRMADAYTLYAFLRQTPDVQRTLVKVFSQGDIWLDTTVVLQLFVETLLDGHAQRHFTTILDAAAQAGLHLYVTHGVVEEVQTHMGRCLAFARAATGKWNGRVPFVYSAYAAAGRSRAQFASWAENFMGSSLPTEDICDYLSNFHKIKVRDLAEEADKADIELRSAVQEIWMEAHKQRRRTSFYEQDVDETTKLLLAKHDVENTVGVMMLRRQVDANPMGYRHWWLTLDRVALDFSSKLRDALGRNAPLSPAISPDFMAEYLRIGQLRTAIENDQDWRNLPILTDISRYEHMPRELIERADRLRSEAADMAEHVVRRKIRDDLNGAKLRHGPEALAGIAGADDRFKERIARNSGSGNL